MIIIHSVKIIIDNNDIKLHNSKNNNNEYYEI